MIALTNLYGVPVLAAEMATCMRLLGAKNISDLGPKYVSHSVPKDICGSRAYRITSGEADMDVLRSTRGVWRGISTTASLGWISAGFGRGRSCEVDKVWCLIRAEYVRCHMLSIPSSA